MVRTTTERKSQQQQQRVSRRAVIEPRISVRKYNLCLVTNEEVNGKVLRIVEVTNYVRNGRLLKKLGDIKVLQGTQDGRTKDYGDPIFYYKRGINLLKDISTTLLSRHQVKKGDVVEVIFPKKLYDTDKYSQKKFYGVIDNNEVDNQNQLEGDREIGLIIKFHKDHKNTMKINGNTRSLNQEWVCVNLSNVKFVKRNAILGKDYIGSLSNVMGVIPPPHPSHLFLRECGHFKPRVLPLIFREHFLKKK